MEVVTLDPIVSVVIPVWNSAGFLGEAIESVLAQTYNRWELLLVNDGSTDGSTDVARRYAGEHPEQIRCLEHEGGQNRGVGASRNLGVKQAVGSYVAFLDHDDVWLPRKLEQQVGLLDAHPEAGLLYGRSLWWHGWTGRHEDRDRDFLHELGVRPNTLLTPPRALVLLLQSYVTTWGRITIPHPSNILMRREVFDRAGYFEEAFVGTFQMYEDHAFFSKVFLQVPVLVSDACWIKYRQHPSSVATVACKTGIERVGRRNFLNWLTAYLSNQEMKDREVWQTIRAEQWRYRHPTLHRLRSGAVYREVRGRLIWSTAQAVPVPIRRALRAYWPGLGRRADSWVR
jgi:glycosyltransferase involved in cell wall biosynthesis